MLEAERREAGHVLVAYLLASGTQLLQCGVHVDRVPKDYRVQHQAQGAELVLLALPVSLAELAPAAVEDLAAELVVPLADRDLGAGTPSVRVVDVNEGEQVTVLAMRPYSAKARPSREGWPSRLIIRMRS